MSPLPDYPGFTPIERLWSEVVNIYPRWVAPRGKETESGALGGPMKSVMADEVVAWFEHAGLCATRR
jgi:hypothetical protein